MHSSSRARLLIYNMKTLTRHLPPKYRSLVRFTCVGAFGTALQYGIYYVLLQLFERYCPDFSIKITVAFTVGFIIEMGCNYLLTSFYTFRTRPSLRNAGGFLFGRLLNYFVQMGFLYILIACTMPEEWAGIAAIVLAGIVNYFVLIPFYKNKTPKTDPNKKNQH